MGEVFARNSETRGPADVTVVTPFAGRFWWYTRAFGFNPLVRVTDRLEAFVVFAVLFLALTAIPTAAQAGSLIYDSNMRTAEQQAHSRHSVQALVVEGRTIPPADAEGSAYDGSSYARVQWREGTHLRTEEVVRPAAVKTGDQLKIWLDDTGKIVSAPLTKEDATVNAFAAAWMAWTGIVAGCVLVAFVVRRGLDRSRDRSWERELLVLAHNDDGWANRHK
jgi:hypothetical protein